MKAFLTIFITVTLSWLVHATCPRECKCAMDNGREVLNCYNQNLTALPKNIDNETEVLDMSENQLINLTYNYFAKTGNLFQLKEIYLRRCSIKYIHRHAFIGLKYLSDLNLSKNNIHAVPGDIFSSIRRLRTLDLKNNPITRIGSSDFDVYLPLERLDISSCEINYIHPNAFVNQHYLKSLNLSNNKLRTLFELLITDLQDIQELNLRGNPWQCDCNLTHLYGFLDSVFDSQSLKCETPSRLEGKRLTDIRPLDLACSPTISTLDENISVGMNQTISLECRANGDPEPAISWDDGNDLILSGIEEPTGVPGTTKSVISIKHVEKDRCIRCIAKNPAGEATHTYKLTVSDNRFSESVVASSLLVFVVISTTTLFIIA